MQSSSLGRRMVRGVLLLFIPPTVVAAGVLVLLYSLDVHRHPAALVVVLLAGGGAMMSYVAFMIHGMADSLAATLRDMQFGVELMGTTSPPRPLAIETGDELETLAAEINRVVTRLAGERDEAAALLEALPTTFVTTTADGRVLFATTAAQRMLAPDGPPLVGSDLVKGVQPADAPFLHDALQAGGGTCTVRVGDGRRMTLTVSSVHGMREGHPAFVLVFDAMEMPTNARPRELMAGVPSGPVPRRAPSSDLSLQDDAPDLCRSLTDLDCVFLDAETTGFDRDGRDRIVALAAVRVRRGAVQLDEAFSSLVNPGRTIPLASTAVHGITDAMVSDAPPIDSVLPDFWRFTRGSLLGGHDVWFDLHFLSRESRRIGLPTFDATQPVLDTAHLARLVDSRMADVGLEGIAVRLGVSIDSRHSALHDAAAAAEVCIRLLAILAGRGIATLADVLEACARLRRVERL